MLIYKSADQEQAILMNGTEIVVPASTGQYPVLIYNPPDGVLLNWLKENKGFIDTMLVKYGAVLFRGFHVKDVHGFKEVLPGLFNEEIEYKERSSPRHAVIGNIYSSTDHPSDEVIHMHTESSYASVYPNRICFYSHMPAASGGETPIADVRNVVKLIRPHTIEKFRDRGVMYVRNITSGIGLTWKETFQVNSKAELERTLSDAHLKHEWVTQDHLRITWIRPALQKHPVSGEWVWFNHAFFYSKHLMDEYILEVIPEEELPFLSYYGDGSEIEKDVIAEIKQAYDCCSILFRWEKDDVLLLDNMLFAHGRMPFTGERKILVAMGNPVR